MRVLTLFAIGSGGVLLTGSHGSGKTSIVDQVISKLKNDSQALTCKFRPFQNPGHVFSELIISFVSRLYRN